MTPRLVHHRRRAPRDPLGVGLAALGLLAVAFVLSLTHQLPFVGDDGRTLTAEFPGARQVNDKTPVRVRGIGVGEVREVRYDAGRRLTEVELRLDDDGVRLHRDARAALRWRTVLGGRMELALDPGSPSAPAMEGDRIPLARTRVQTEFEDVTGVLDGRGTQGTRALLQELPQALRGGAAGAAIDALPAVRPLAPAMRALRGARDGDLAGLVRSSARTLRAADRARGALGAFVGGADATLRTTAAREADLRATFARAPGALAQTVRTAGIIDRTLPELDAVAQALRPGARRLAPALAATRPTVQRLSRVLRDARPVVRALRPAVSELAGAATTGRRLLAALSPTVTRLDDDLVPFLERRDPDIGLPVFQLIGPTVSSLGAAGSLFHDQGHIVNFPVQPGENALGLLPCSTFLTDPTAAQKLRCDRLGEGLEALLGLPARRSRP
ncbi:MlaD family protein [Conexibacter sp. SYSU D00693]|uniref:MlaD family protein n=1 Tax=Conexibacter sp. SYSU D00693 TaxID=2812560 RepID=UPI00196BA083|nr:MlaD family protein [Conexibacter sp. SYSU D00693]